MLTRHPKNVDQLAQQFMLWGAQARSLPPSFAGAGHTIPGFGVGGERLGVMLPGLGFQLDVDPCIFGITKPMPNVFSRSAFERARDWGLNLVRRLANDERGAITTFDGIIASRGGGKADDVAAIKQTFTSVANTWVTTYRAGGMPAAGSYTNISTGATKNNTDAGALSLALSNPTGGDTKYILSVASNSSAVFNQAFLTDLLWAGGNCSANTTSAQTVSSAALTRYTTGTGLVITMEVTTALGATPSAIACSYTNQANTSGQTTGSASLTPSAIVQRLQPSAQLPVLPLASGDFGVRAIASVTCGSAMGSGVFAIRISKLLFFMVGSAANIPIQQDIVAGIDGLLPLATEGGGALGCLELWIFANGTSSGDFSLLIKTCAG